MAKTHLQAMEEAFKVAAPDEENPAASSMDGNHLFLPKTFAKGMNFKKGDTVRLHGSIHDVGSKITIVPSRLELSEGE